MSDRRVVAVFGSGEAEPGGDEYLAAERVGRVLAGLGFDVASGGYGGTMEAVCRGAKAGGARVIGVTCRIWPSGPNAFLDRVIETDDLHERVRVLLELGTGGFVALPGATGTLMELAAAWELTAKGLFAGRPVVCVGRFWGPLVELIARSRPAAAGPIRLVDSPEGLSQHFPRQPA